MAYLDLPERAVEGEAVDDERAALARDCDPHAVQLRGSFTSAPAGHRLATLRSMAFAGMPAEAVVT